MCLKYRSNSGFVPFRLSEHCTRLSASNEALPTYLIGRTWFRICWQIKFLSKLVSEWSLVLQIELDDAAGYWTVSSIVVVAMIGALDREELHVNNSIILDCELSVLSSKMSNFKMKSLKAGGLLAVFFVSFRPALKKERDPAVTPIR